MKHLKQKQKNWILSAAIVAGAGVIGSGSTLPAAETPGKPAPRSITDSNGNVYTVGPDGKLVKNAEPKKAENPVFAAFAQWMTKYSSVPTSQRKQMESEGVRLATQRRPAMAELIQSDPKRAIELSVGSFEQQKLPAAVVQQLEEVLQGRGEYSIFHIGERRVVQLPGKPEEKRVTTEDHYRKTFFFNNRVYNAFVYGERAGLTSKNDLPFYGIAIDDKIVLHESPVWVLKAGQSLPAGAKPSKNGTSSPVTGKDASRGIIGIVGSTVYYLESAQDLEQFNQQLWEAEQIIGPNEHA